MRAAGEPYATWAATGRQFLAFDPAGDGTAVEVLGDLSTADRIAVLVPGVDTTLRDFDRGLGGVARRAPAVQARALYDSCAPPTRRRGWRWWPGSATTRRRARPGRRHAKRGPGPARPR